MSEKNEMNQEAENILAALGPRAEEEVLPEPTQDEIVAEALASAGVEERFSDQPELLPPQIEPLGEPARKKVEEAIGSSEISETISTSPETMTILNNPSSTEILVSNIDLQSEGETSTPASLGKTLPTSKETNFDNLCRFMEGPEFNLNWVRLNLLGLSRFPDVLPSITLWKIPPSLDVAQVVYDILKTPGYVATIWPSLEVVMGSSLDNTTWTAKVCVTLALFDAIRILPLSAYQRSPNLFVTE